MPDIMRRDFVTLLGGRLRRSNRPRCRPLGASTTSIQGQWVATLVQRLRELGWIGAEPDFVLPPFKKVKP